MTTEPDTTSTGEPAWRLVIDEIADVLAAVTPEDLAALTDFVSERPGRWFVTGQGRSGLVARMVAMRLMHLGRPTHVVGDATAPAIEAGDHLIALSSSGATPVTMHLAEVATQKGADLLAITSKPDSTISRVASATVHLRTGTSAQFGGSLFEQSALLLFDAVILSLTDQSPGLHDAMSRRHANLQ